jgi:glycosyltransferase involved in cell wall biosynthesis
MKMVMAPSILFLTNAYPDFESSYRGVFIQKMAALIKDEGYEISVVTPKIYRKSLYHEKRDGIKVYRFPFFARDKLLIEYRNIPYVKMIMYYLTGFLWAFYAILRNRCDMIHIHWAIPTGLIGVLVGDLLKKPVIVTIHGSDFRMAKEGSKLLKNIFLYVCRRSKQIFCVSELQTKEIEKMGVKGEKISTLPMGIEESFLEAGRNRRERLGLQEYTILSNRNLLPIYNVSLLIRAIPIVLAEEPRTMFLIAGEGTEKGALEREVRNLNINSSVKFLGRVPHEEMPNLLAQVDIYVSTSLCDGTSVSLLEAMGSGAFPVVTDIPANKEWVINGENGFLVNQSEEKILARKIIDAMRNRDLLERSQAKNRVIVEDKALWKEHIRRVKSIYTSTLSS